MGYAIASQLVKYGAQVVLISGPSNEKPPENLFKLIPVTTASQMHNMCLSVFPEMDGAFLVAAVSDYRPKITAQSKIKRTAKTLTLELEANPDIAADLGKIKKKKQFLIGFALETDNAIDNAFDKMKRKNFDFIILNTLQDEGAGFSLNTNKITILDKNNRITKFPLKPKHEVAEDIIEYLHSII
jgi:phosphopantothenoylcysteine decarboxylase/phosphopantothenate--cysteine ligase